MEPSPPDIPSVFGDEVLDKELADWLDRNYLSLAEWDLLETGGSGGRLVSAYLQDLRPGRPSGLRIIKLVPPSGDADAELRNHRAALSDRGRDNEDFISRRLVELDDRTGRLGDYWLMIQHPAGDGTEEMRTLSGLGLESRTPSLVAEVVTGVLGGWNPDPLTGRKPEGGTGRRLSAAQFVTDILGTSPTRIHRLQEWLEHRWGVGSKSEYVSPEGGSRVLPNPLALADGSPLSGCQVRLAVRGRAHGDLHPGNIMVTVKGAGSTDFWLVDLCRYRPDALLARDPVHLLMCVIADEFLPHMSGQAREELVTALAGYDPECHGLLIPQGLADTVTRVRKAMIDWGARHSMGPGWRQQWYLALQACALMVTARDRYEEHDRWWFFRLAAEACDAYLAEEKVERPGTAESRPFGKPAAPLSAPSVDSVPSSPDRTPAPASRGRAEEGTGLLDLLTGIWDLFMPHLRALSTAPLGNIESVTVAYIGHHATDFRLALGDPSLDVFHGAGADGEVRLVRILALLRDVERGAQALFQLLRQPMRRMAMLAYGQDQPELRDFVDVLADLLDEVSAACRALAPRA